jgi:hypothetical protein
MKIGVLNAMLGPILSNLSDRMAETGNTKELQALTLTSIRPMVLEEGGAAVELHLDGMPVRVALQEGSIPQIIALLTELERMIGGSGSAACH